MKLSAGGMSKVLRVSLSIESISQLGHNPR